MIAAAIPYPVIDPVLFELGPLVVRWYALAYIAGLIIGWRYVARLMDARALWGAEGPPASREDIDDLLVWIAFGVILGGRVGYVLFYRPELLASPMDAIAIWKGGMSFHGGLLGVALAILIFALRRGANPFSLGDAVSAAAPIGLFFGRIANFINAELWGRPSDVPWAMVFPNDPAGLARHPSQLYEAALEGLVLFVVLRVLTHRLGWLKRPGAVFGALLLGYGLARSFVELYREPDAHIGFLSGGLTMGMMLSAPMALAGLTLILWARLRS